MNAFELSKDSAESNVLAWLNDTPFVSYGIVRRVIDTQTVVVEQAVRDTASPDLWTVALLTPSSRLYEMSIIPEEGDLVLLLSLQKYNPAMFDIPVQRFEAYNEWAIFDPDATGYTKFSGVGILLSTPKGAASTTVKHSTSEGSAILALDTVAHVAASFMKQVNAIFDSLPEDDNTKKERLVSLLFCEASPFLMQHWARVNREHGFWEDSDGTLTEVDATVSEKYSEYAPIMKNIQGTQTYKIGIDDTGADTDAAVSIEMGSNVPVTLTWRSGESIEVGDGKITINGNLEIAV
jgi:hypothetical protein